MSLNSIFDKFKNAIKENEIIIMETERENSYSGRVFSNQEFMFDANGGMFVGSVIKCIDGEFAIADGIPMNDIAEFLKRKKEFAEGRFLHFENLRGDLW